MKRVAIFLFLFSQTICFAQSRLTLSDAVNIANDLYMAGYANYLEVITAQKNALEAELGVVKTRKQLFFSVVNLYRSLGGGW